MRALRWFGICCAAFLVAGCESNNIFYADFDSDTVGARPNTSPAGAPSGDTIYIANPVGEAPETVQVVNDPDFAGNSLRYSNVDASLFYRYVGFISDDADPTADRIQAHWVGKLLDSPNMFALDVWLGDSHFLALATLRFQAGRISLQTSGGSAPSYESLGAYTSGDVHTIFMTADRASGTYDISILKNGGNITVSDRPVLNPDALDATNPSLYLFFGDDVSSAATYTVDEVTILEIFDEEMVREGLPLP